MRSFQKFSSCALLALSLLAPAVASASPPVLEYGNTSLLAWRMFMAVARRKSQLAGMRTARRYGWIGSGMAMLPSGC